MKREGRGLGFDRLVSEPGGSDNGDERSCAVALQNNEATQ